MQAVEEVEARDIEPGDVLVNIGEVLDVKGANDFVLIKTLLRSTSVFDFGAYLSRSYRDIDTLVRFKKWSD